jgi:hypothetical protein
MPHEQHVYVEEVQAKRKRNMPAAGGRRRCRTGDSWDVGLADGRGAQDPSYSYAGGDIAGAPCSGDGASGPGNGAEAARGTSDYSGRVRLLSEGPTPTGGAQWRSFKRNHGRAKLKKDNKFEGAIQDFVVRTCIGQK